MKVAKIESFGSRLGIWLSPPISINPSKLPKFEQVLARQNNKKNNTWISMYFSCLNVQYVRDSTY